MTKFVMVTKVGRNLFFGGQPRPRFKGRGPASPKLFWTDKNPYDAI